MPAMESPLCVDSPLLVCFLRSLVLSRGQAITQSKSNAGELIGGITIGPRLVATATLHPKNCFWPFIAAGVGAAKPPALPATDHPRHNVA